MLIIIEGNEGSGKTTLINQLAERIPFVTVKYPKNVKDNFNMLVSFASDEKHTFVLDRSFISDMVYRNLDHEKGQMNLYEIGTLCTFYDGIKIVFCWNDKSFENSMRRGEDNIIDEDVHRGINEAFMNMRTLIECFTDVRCYDYNYEYDSVESVIDFIGGK